MQGSDVQVSQVYAVTMLLDQLLAWPHLQHIISSASSKTTYQLTG